MSREDNAGWWNRVRQMGFWRFVLIYGVGFFGGVSFVIWMAAHYLGFVGARFGIPGMLSWFALGGWISGGLVWIVNEFIYRKFR